MFGFFAHFARFKRVDASLFLVAALLALWTMPSVAQTTLAPNSSQTQAILFLLASEAHAPRAMHLGAPTLFETQTPERDEAPLESKATAHCGAFQVAASPATPRTLRSGRTHELSAHVVARLSGVQTQVRLN